MFHRIYAEGKKARTHNSVCPVFFLIGRWGCVEPQILELCVICSFFNLLLTENGFLIFMLVDEIMNQVHDRVSCMLPTGVLLFL